MVGTEILEGRIMAALFGGDRAMSHPTDSLFSLPFDHHVYGTWEYIGANSFALFGGPMWCGRFGGVLYWRFDASRVGISVDDGAKYERENSPSRSLSALM